LIHGLRDEFHLKVPLFAAKQKKIFIHCNISFEDKMQQPLNLFAGSSTEIPPVMFRKHLGAKPKTSSFSKTAKNHIEPLAL
jgi:hypothetical protein